MRSRVLVQLYFQPLTQKIEKFKMAAAETKISSFRHIFGTKHDRNINKTCFLMFSGTRNPLKSLFYTQHGKKVRWLPYYGKSERQ